MKGVREHEKSQEAKETGHAKATKVPEVVRHETVHHEPAKVPEVKAELPEVLEVKHCKNCGKEFTVKKHRKHFCSGICRSEH